MRPLFEWDANPDYGVEYLTYTEWGYLDMSGQHDEVGGFLPLCCTPLGSLPYGMAAWPEYRDLLLAHRVNMTSRRVTP